MTLRAEIEVNRSFERGCQIDVAGVIDQDAGVVRDSVIIEGPCPGEVALRVELKRASALFPSREVFYPAPGSISVRPSMRATAYTAPSASTARL